MSSLLVQRALLASACTVNLLSAAALAQEAKDAPQAASASGLEEIIVTAQRREENLQRVPVAVSAFSGAQLEKLGAADVRDLNQFVPGLNLQIRGNSTQPMIRGVGTTAQVVGNESAVATYVDGAYYPVTWGGLFRLADVERIEVLRGPQGTLFGRNATGGLINIITRKPATDDFHADFSVGYGNYNSADFDGYLTGPVSDTVAVSLSGYYGSSDGYLRNPNKPGKNVNATEGGGVRGKIAFAPGSQFSATLSADYGFADDPTQVLPTIAANSSPFINPAGPAPLITTSDTPYRVTGSFAKADFSQRSVTLQLNGTFANFDVFSTTAYRESNYEADNDGDMGPFEVVRLSFTNNTDNISEDVRIQSNGAGPLQWIAGLFAFHGKDGFENFDYQIGAPPYAAPNYSTILLINKAEIATDAYAAYGQVSYDIGERVTAIAGLRYSMERKSVDAVARGLPTQSADEDFDDLAPKLTLQYKLGPDAMIYATYGQAFKSGTYNPTQIADPGHPEDATIVVAPEEIDAYQIGFKADLTANLRANVEGFYYKYDNLQTTVDTGVVNILNNAGKATIKGAEAELLSDISGIFSASDSLRIFGNVAYLDAVYDSYANASVSVPNGPGGGLLPATIDASGNRMVRTPDWTGTIGFDYSNSFGWGMVDLNLNAFRSAKFFFDEGNTDLFAQQAYTKLNASIAWTSPDERHKVTLWGKNLTDSETFMNPYLQGTFGLGKSWYPPTTYGAAYRVRF